MTTPKTLIVAALLAFAAVAGAAGYWLGTRSQPGLTTVAPAASASAPRQLLYYRNPMGLADSSMTPKKDPMGMDYIPVYAGEDADESPKAAAGTGAVRISAEKVQKLGVRTEAARMRVLGRSLRAAGRIEVDERRIVAVTPKFEGYVERLHVNVTGQAVARGQPLFDVYSPELVAAQREYAIAIQGLDAMKGAASEARGGMQQLAEASLEHLRHWGLSPDQLAALMQTGQTQRTVSFVSPVSGTVTEKKALQGMRFMPGDTLYQITDLSSIWVVADVFEQDIGQIRIGAMATVRVDAYPGEAWAGRIAYVYPLLKPETRTVPVRVELANPGLRLKPAMYAQVELGVGGAAAVLTVPESAVIDSGMRRIVLVQTGPGRFEPREVEIGERSADWVELRRGVREGEQVVVAANFLIDAESNLKAVIGNLGGLGRPAASASPSASASAAASGLTLTPQAKASGATATAKVESTRPVIPPAELSAAPPPLPAPRAAHPGH